ncbi:hypothetical protein SNE40_015156 [Patella caerulea]|uniref:RabBD domain-containing protein n=1 Tax=Patella caerulea TaxID=87958 RepID=A0AAN8PUQ7_PATCE
MHHSPLTSAWIVVGDSDFFIVVYLCLFFTSLVLLRVFELSLGKAMGNENSTLSSECSTPPSDFLEYESLYSVTTDNRGGSSRPSTRAPSPMEPPEPDLSHLTPEEIAQIKAVMDRAKDMQVDEQKRVR